jgi:hypothetical protein
MNLDHKCFIISSEEKKKFDNYASQMCVFNNINSFEFINMTIRIIALEKGKCAIIFLLNTGSPFDLNRSAFVERLKKHGTCKALKKRQVLFCFPIKEKSISKGKERKTTFN